MFTRNKYDVQDYNRDLYQTIRPGHFKTNLPRNTCDGCLNAPFHNASNGNSIYENKLIDVDSDLMGLNVKNSKCPEKLFNPEKANEKFKQSMKTNYSDCMNFVGESTRLSNPTCTLRGTGWNRWEWLCQNPQDRAIVPFNTQLNTSIMTKDDHRPCIPQFVDNSLSLPVSENNDDNVVMYYDQNIKNGLENKENFFSQNWKNCAQI